MRFQWIQKLGKLLLSKLHNIGLKGFSLLEVMVAVSVLAISIVLIFQIFSIGLRGTKKTESYTKALVIARALLDEALAVSDVEDADTTMEYEDGFSASRTVKKISSDEETNSRLYLITVRVKWPPSGMLEVSVKRSVYEKKPLQ